jgi:hypothetical protein
MINDFEQDDIDFALFLMSKLPVGFLSDCYMDYMVIKNYKQSQPITKSDINRLELQLKLGAYKSFTNKKD